MEPFFTTKHGGKGTGLGLAMVFNTARAHGGAFTLDSAPGKGTRATLAFPAAPIGAPGGADPAPAHAPRGKSILLVDDDELVRGSVPALLGAMGHRVEPVEGGHAALARLDSDRPDLVILDLNMPGMDGLEVLAHIRSRFPDLPVLLATGFLEPAAEAALEFDPRTLFLQKPFTLAEIQDRIHQAVPA
jgi:CheY-like chemotaxis protein